MNKLIAHAVAASLALFTLSEGPADKAAEAPASTPRAPDKSASSVGPVEPAKRAESTKAAPVKAAEPSKAAGTTRAPAPARTAEPAKTVDPKPCEPVKPCSID